MLERASTSAPAASSRATASALFSAAAHISAVWPRQLSVASIVAPAARSWSSTATRPVRAATIRTVSPAGVAVFGSAPAASSAPTTAGSPLSAASASGVMP